MSRPPSPTGPGWFQIYTARRNLDLAVAATLLDTPAGQVSARTRWQDGELVLDAILVIERERQHENGAVPDTPLPDNFVLWVGEEPSVRHWLARLTDLLLSQQPRRRSSFSDLIG